MLIKFANDTSLGRVAGWRQGLNVSFLFLLNWKITQDQQNKLQKSVNHCGQKGEIRCLNAKLRNLTRQQFNKKSVGVMLDNRPRMSYSMVQY